MLQVDHGQRNQRPGQQDAQLAETCIHNNCPVALHHLTCALCHLHTSHVSSYSPPPCITCVLALHRLGCASFHPHMSHVPSLTTSLHHRCPPAPLAPRTSTLSWPVMGCWTCWLLLMWPLSHMVSTWETNTLNFEGLNTLNFEGLNTLKRSLETFSIA